MTSIIFPPSKHPKAVFNVKVFPHIYCLPQIEGQLAAAVAAAAAAARGNHDEQSVPAGIEWVFKKSQGHLPDLSWVFINEPQSSCVVV